MRLQEIDIIKDAIYKITSQREKTGRMCLRRVLCMAVFELFTQLFVGEAEHAAFSVLDDSNLFRVHVTLRDDDAAQCLYVVVKVVK